MDSILPRNGASRKPGAVHTLTTADLERLAVLDAHHSFDGDGRLLRLGLQAYALGIAYEFDPYFGLSISRVDPLPHQLEAVYDYLLKLARVRFLLADDAGAGKTIRSGLLIRELALRGLAERILIVCPANLALDVTHADGATAGQSAYVRVEVPEPAPEPEPVPVPALPFLDWAIEWVIRQAQSLLRR